MAELTFVVAGTVKPDGTLELDERVKLPAGRVKVIVEASDALKNDPFWQMMEKIWADQKAQGHVPRTREQIDAEARAFRDEAEDEFLEAERLHEECQRLRREAEENKA